MSIIYAIPGLGTTKELFENIRINGHTLKVLEWPVPEAKQSLGDYAKEFLRQMDISEPVNLLGVSFGGMLSCEIAELIPVNKIVLISSCKNSLELPSSIKLLRWLPVQKLMSERLYRRFGGRMSWAVGFQKNYLPQFITMMRAMPKNYFRHCVNMIIHWNRKINSQRIYHIHGSCDNLLPHTAIRDFEVVDKGNHAMVVYKAQEINVYLNTIFNGSQNAS